MNQLFSKRIPTLLGIGLVIIGIILTTEIIKNQTNLRSVASNSEEPQNVKITNLSDNSFTITYQTNSPITGSVNYGKNKELGNTELDDLDKEKGNFSPKNIHSITVKNLSPDTKYFLVIISGNNTFLNNGTPFEILTGPSIAPSSSQITIKGKVILPDGSFPNEAIAYLNADNSQLLSTLVGKDGEFNFSLNSLRFNDLSSYFTINDNTILKLLVIDKSLKSNISISPNQTNSIPTITLSNDYDFINTITPIASNSAESLGFPSIKQEDSKPQILTPKKDQSFTDQQPQFTGTSLPNENVQIIIHSIENIQTQVTSDSNGNWTYRPPSNLSPGPHTITVVTRNSSGILTTLMQSFTVFASEAQISESATPSATPTLLPTIMLTPTPTPSPSPTFILEDTKGGLPPVGNSFIVIIIGGIFTAISGIALFLLTRTIL